jgi:hypothetical protein
MICKKLIVVSFIVMSLSLSVDTEEKCIKCHLSSVTDLFEIFSPIYHFPNLLMDCVVKLNCY